ncbi:MAG: MFS transporter [Marinomonas sp.]
MPQSQSPDRQSARFLLLYALASAGGAISYVPFLTILLPARVTQLAGDEAVGWLAYIAFVGAIAASIGNIGFGWLSDITRNRRGWILAGLALSSLVLLSVGPTQTLMSLLIQIAIWQLCLNMMLSPLAAWAGDCVPDAQKGLLGGLLSIAPAVGGLSGALVTWPGVAEGSERLTLVAIMVAICVVPVVLLGKPRPMPALSSSLAQADEGAAASDIGDYPPLQTAVRQAVLRMWFARLLIQIAEAALFAFLLIWLISLDPSFTESETAGIFSLALIIAIPVALGFGRWADAYDRPIVPLWIAALVCAVGLSIMALSDVTNWAVAGYVVFGVAGAVFLSLHSAQTLRILPRSSTRARDLGIFNLTNTVPSLIMPWLTLALVPLFGFAGLFILLAAMAIIAAILLFSIPLRK